MTPILDDLDIFYVTASEFVNAESDSWMSDRLDAMDASVGDEVDGLAGFYFAWGQMGRPYDMEPAGPFESRDAAYAAAENEAQDA